MVAVCAGTRRLIGAFSGRKETLPMAGAQDGTLEMLVGKVAERAEAGEKISISLIQQIAGQRAAGPLLLLPALIVVSPLSIIPGLPTIVGINTILVAGQVVLGREQVWLPEWLRKRCLSAKHAKTLANFLKPVSKAADGVVRRRYRFLTSAPMRRAGAAICVLVGAIMPLLEFVPFTSTWAAAIIAVYALAITARDGFLALAWLGLVLAAAGIGYVVWQMVM
jgi:hypothetical protein